MRIRTSTLNYDKPYRPLRDCELQIGRKFVRVTLNGQYRCGKAYHAMHRRANPGWSFGFERLFVNWTHFRRHCWHFSFNAGHKGLTFSYGKRV